MRKHLIVYGNSEELGIPFIIQYFYRNYFQLQKIKSIPYHRTGYFTRIICDYLDQNEGLKAFYGNFPDMAGFEEQIQAKGKSFSFVSRKVLQESLLRQNSNFDISDNTLNNIELLSNENTFTVTTGHQLNLFTGPLYFLYKIVSAINLSGQLKKKFPEYDFVPVYWMATEDHDFEEINFFNFKRKKISWDGDNGGAVGRLTTNGLDKVHEEFARKLGSGKNAQYLNDLFRRSYLEHENLTDATRYLANELFGKYGLVILDGDDKRLKGQFSSFMKEELLEHYCFNEVTKANKKLAYKIQVNPREINLFYLNGDLRERIVFEDGLYKINHSQIKFTEEEILLELEDYPEKFSPNVLMRPLYQEVILPNLCYIGGGGELAYWFELKRFFKSQEVVFPVLLLRNSVLLITNKQRNKLERLDVSPEELFMKRDDLIHDKVRFVSDIEIDLSNEKEQLNKMFEQIEKISNTTDRSFLGAVKAQRKKQQNGLDKLEKRLLKAQKRKYIDLVERITFLQEELFPDLGLQERNTNFSEFYEEVGEELISGLIENLDPLQLQFDLIRL